MLGKIIPLLLIVTSLTCPVFASTNDSRADSNPPYQPQSLSQSRPIFFTENKGQWDERVLFKADGTGELTWWIERDGFTILFSVPDMEAEPLSDEWPDLLANQVSRDMGPDLRASRATRSHALKFKFQNTLPRNAGNFLPEQTTPAIAASVESANRLSHNNNYFIGNDKSEWAPDCGNFQRVVLKDVWPGVDIVWRGGTSSVTAPSVTANMNDDNASDCRRQGGDRSAAQLVEFDFIVHPNADPNAIRIEVLGLTDGVGAQGLAPLRMDGEELLLPTSLGVLHQALPEAFQIDENGSLAPVRAEFAVAGGNSFGVVLPEGFDKTKPLIVDPLVYSTYLGGNAYDIAFVITSDGAGGVVVAGETYGSDFPTTEGAYQTNFGGGGYDAFIARLSEDGSELLYNTYLGGTNYDAAFAITPDGAGGVVVAGETLSQNFPTTEGAYQRDRAGNWDAFVVQLNSEGSALLYSTFLGGENADFAFGLTADDAGGVVVGGLTLVGDFPITDGACQINYGGGHSDAFVARLSFEGNGVEDLLYSTYLGGNDEEGERNWYLALTSDGEGGIIVAGLTYSDNFPTTEGAYQRDYGGGGDAFVTRLNAEGSEIIYSTLLGGNSRDHAYVVIPDRDGGVVVAGWTDGNFPTTDGAYQRNFGGGDIDAFVTQLNSEGSEIIYSTYLGGNGDDNIVGLIPNGAGGVVVAGHTSGDFPTTEGAYQRNYGGGLYDVFIANLNEDGDELLYSTYLGGNGGDYGSDLIPDGAGGVVVSCGTQSDNFPTTEGAYQRNYGGGMDVFITDIDFGLPFFHWVEVPDEVEADENELVEFTVRGEGTDENAGLSIIYSSDDLPDSARFEDNGDGSGTFHWQTSNADSGHYTAVFTLSDGEHELARNVAIIVNNINGPPRWIDIQDSISVQESSELVLMVSGFDPDGDSLSIIAFSDNLPQDWQFTDNDDGTGAFAWTPGLGRAGNYSATFILSDADTSVGVVVHIIVLPYNSVADPGHSIPDHFYLSTNFPNPFNAVTRVVFGLPEASRVTISVLDVSGREVSTLISGELEAGYHNVVWNGETASAGLYLVKMETPTITKVSKMTLLK